MSSSFTYTDTHAFTLTHAKHLAAKVATDLKRIQRLYDEPSDSWIEAYETEAIKLLRAGYVASVTYGFRRNGNWIEPTLRYTERDLQGIAAADNDPGRIRPGSNVAHASFSSYLTYNAAWHILSGPEKESFEQRLPFRRSYGSQPGIDGYISHDLTYSSGGRALDRAVVRSWR